MKRTFLLVTLVLVLLTLNTLNPKGLADPLGLARVTAQSGGSPAATLAPGYDLTWYTIDAGGGISDHGGYMLAGTIAQADAAAWRNVGYTLVGGFWSSLAGQYRTYLPLILKNA